MIRPGIRRLFHLDLRRRDVVERDVEAEIAHHLELRYQQLLARGAPSDDARREAERQFGDMATARAALRHAASEREHRLSVRDRLQSLTMDLRYALRGLRRAPSFTAFVVVVLALGIGVNAAMFGIADRLLIRGPEHVRDASRVVRVYAATQSPGKPERITSSAGYVSYDILRTQAHSFEDVAAYAVNAGVIGRGDDEAAASISAVTANFFPLLGVLPIIGRPLLASDDAVESPEHVAVISEGLWQRRFGGDAAVIGRSLVLNSETFVVVGVMPRGFTGATLAPVDAWIPMTLLGSGVAPAWTTTWKAQWLTIIGRLRSGVTPTSAGTDATNALRNAMPVEERPADRRAFVAGLGADGAGQPSAEAVVARWLLVVAAIVLVIACSNVINLLLARANRRRSEFGIRLAMGAGRWWLVRLVLIESLLLALLGAVAGLSVTAITGHLVRELLLPGIAWPHSPVDPRTIVFALLAGVALAVLIGVVPAIQLSRNELVGVLKAAARQQTGRRTAARNVLTVAQAALSVVLLTGAGLFVTSLARIRSLDLGFQPDRVLAVPLNYPGLGKLRPEDAAIERARRRAALPRMVDRIKEIPGVTTASAAIGIPFGNEFVVSLHVPGQDSMSSNSEQTPTISAVSPDYFATVGTRIVSGRGFTSSDQPTSEHVAIVSERMARTLWPGANPIGQCLIIGADTMPCARVVGVAANVYRRGLHERPSMRYYIPTGQESGFGGAAMLVRAPGDPMRFLPDVITAMREMEPTLRRLAGGTMQQAIDPQIRPWRVGAIIFSLLGALALLVATLGLYGLIAYQVSERTREFGVRIALGARGGDILSTVLRSAAALSIGGTAIGIALALVGAPYIQPLLFDTSARNPVVLGCVALTLLLSAISAGIYPAWRAARTDPMHALRAD